MKTNMQRYLVVWCLAVASSFASIKADPVYTKVSVTTSGINHDNTNAPNCSPMQMKSGVTALDYNGDGWTDLFFTRVGQTDILYRNVNGTFYNLSSSAGFTQEFNSTGCVSGDVDNDGDPDLYITSLCDKRFYLYINNNGVFTEVAQQRGAALDSPVPLVGTSATMGDYDGDGYLDIHTCEWRLHDSQGYMNHSRLLRNRGAAQPGFFDDVTEEAGVMLDEIFAGQPGDPGNGVWSLASRFCDIDQDGHLDLLLASDFCTSRLFWNNGDGTFTDGTEAGNLGTDCNGMGNAVGDFDGDGLLDWFITTINDNRLYRNNGDRTFTDMTDQDATHSVRRGGWGWAAAFLDYDNDMDVDLAMTNGYPAIPFPEQNVMWENHFGRYTNVSTEVGFTETTYGMGLLTFDYDKDGDLDVLMTNNVTVPILYRNDGDYGDNRWLRVKGIGTVSNRDGYNAYVIVTPNRARPKSRCVTEISAGNNFLSQNEGIAHIGLGSHSGPIGKVEIRWPSGIVQELRDVQSNQLITVMEPSCVKTNYYTPPYPVGDVNHDCRVNYLDFPEGNPWDIMANWLECTVQCH